MSQAKTAVLLSNDMGCSKGWACKHAPQKGQIAKQQYNYKDKAQIQKQKQQNKLSLCLKLNY